MTQLDDDAIDRALSVWREEADVAYSARIRDYIPDGMLAGPARDAALAGLRAADEEAEAMNRALMRRAILAALNYGDTTDG